MAAAVSKPFAYTLHWDIRRSSQQDTKHFCSCRCIVNRFLSCLEWCRLRHGIHEHCISHGYGHLHMLRLVLLGLICASLRFLLRCGRIANSRHKPDRPHLRLSPSQHALTILNSLSSQSMFLATHFREEKVNCDIMLWLAQDGLKPPKAWR